MRFRLLALLIATATPLTVGACKNSKDSNGSAADQPAPTEASRPAPISVCVMRHAEAYSNLEEPPAGMADADLDALTDAGKAQARAARSKLPASVAIVWSSPRNRTRQTAAALGLAGAAVQVVPELAPLRGDMPWSERVAAWKAGRDPRPARGESLDDGRRRIAAALARLGAMLEPGEAAVLVTHSDLAPVIVGQLKGTPLLERPAAHPFGLADVVCAPLPSS